MSPLRVPLQFRADHPALAGHFPGNPVIPGALLLDAVLAAIESRGAETAAVGGWRIEVAKFLRPARGAEQLQLCITPEPTRDAPRYGFEISSPEGVIARGRLMAQPAVAPDRLSRPQAPQDRAQPAPARCAPGGAHEPGAGAADQGWRDRPERGNALLMRWMVTLSLRLGRPIGRALLYPIALYFFCFAPRARGAMRSYLQRALGRRPRARDHLRLILNFASTIHDRLWLLQQREELFEITLEGEQAVRDAVDSGGAFLMGAHMGSFEVLRLVGRRQGFAVAISMYEAQARRLNALLGPLAPHEALQIIPVGQLDSMLRIRSALQEGRLVGVLADRLFGAEASLPVRFLGATAHFPVNPMRLAAMLRRRVVFMLGLYRGGNRYHVVFEPLADFSRTASAQRQAAIEAAVHRYAQLLERRCRSDPYNWFNFFDFWPAETAAPAAGGASMPRRNAP